MREPNLKERVVHLQLIDAQIELVNRGEIGVSVVNFVDVVVKLALMRVKGVLVVNVLVIISEHKVLMQVFIVHVFIEFSMES